jgi:hypothetical protein
MSEVNLAELAKAQLEEKQYKVLYQMDGIRRTDLTPEGEGMLWWHRNNHVELREYPPVKRNVSIAGRNYYLQFPTMLFLQSGVGTLAVGFVKEPIESFESTIYYPCLPNIFEPGFRVCLTPEKRDLDSLIKAFWNQQFRSYDYSHNNHSIKNTFGRLANWAQCNLDQVNKKIAQGSTITVYDLLHDGGYLCSPKKKHWLI